ncbi:MHYT domain-containing protein [Streptomyces filamentosus]
MNGTIDGFGQGLITPVAGYIMACLGSAPGAPVHGPVGAQRTENAGPAPPRAASVGCGIWTMHFIGMLGSTVRETGIDDDGLLTPASLLFAMASAGVGAGAVAYRGARPPVLPTAGLSTGLGVTGTPCTGVAALSVRLHAHVAEPPAAGSPATAVLPVPAAPLVFLIVVRAIAVLDPLLIPGGGEADIDRWPSGAGRASPFVPQFPGRELVNRPIRRRRSSSPGMQITKSQDARPMP